MNTGTLLNMDEIISSESRCSFFYTMYLCLFATSEALHFKYCADKPLCQLQKGPARKKLLPL